jgi:hypothetical protein
VSFPLALNDALVWLGSRPGRDRGLRTTAIKRRPCGPKTLILALMTLNPEPHKRQVNSKMHLEKVARG